MEYNKNRFQKTNDKKILHKVKKQWVVLSVALLAALGGGATVATTHASANANDGNGQNSDQETTIKNRINQNLKLAQSQSANNNASQGQTKQVNVNSLSSNQITKQANQLHNQMLLGATRNTNDATANGRRAQNTEVNRMNENVQSASSAASSFSNPLASAESVHAQTFGAAAPSANFGAMKKPKMQLGAQAQSFDNRVKNAYVEDVDNSKQPTDAKTAYKNLTSLANSNNVKNAVNNSGMTLGSDAANNSNSNNWIGIFNLTKSNLDTLAKNGSNRKIASLDSKVDKVAEYANDATVSGTVSASSNVAVTESMQSVVNEVAKSNAIAQMKSSAANAIASLPTSDQVTSKGKTVTIDPEALAVSAMSGYDYSEHVSASVGLPATLKASGTAKINTDLENIINSGATVNANVKATISNASTQVTASDVPDLTTNAINNAATSNATNVTIPVTKKTIDVSGINKTLSTTIHYYQVPALKNEKFNAYDIANILDGKNPGNNALKSSYDDLAYNAISGSESYILSYKGLTPDKLSSLANDIRGIANVINDPQFSREYQNIVNDAASLPSDDEKQEHNALSDIATNANGLMAILNNDNKVMPKAKSAVSAGGSYANQWAQSMDTASGSINSASNFASSASSQANTYAHDAAVIADSAKVGNQIQSAVNQMSNDQTIISADSASYSGNPDVSYENSTKAGSGISASLASDAATNASNYAKDASAELSTISSLVDQADSDVTSDSFVSYYLPIHIVYLNADGTTPQSKYNQENNSFVPNSDTATVRLVAKKGTQQSIGRGALLYQNESYINHNLGSDANYTLKGISDNGSMSNGAQSMTANVQTNGIWNWSGNQGNQSTPTFYFQATPQTNNNINVQYINQNGYKVPVYVSSSATNGARPVTSGSYSEDVMYSGASSYGDTINILNDLASGSGSDIHKPVTSANNNSGFYTYGFNNQDVNPSFSDYTFNNSEQTATLPIHGDEINSNYNKLVINVAVRNHKGSFVSSATSSSAFTMSDLASMAGSYGPVHYGDLIKVDPQEFAPNGTDVASSDYNVDPYSTASDNSNQNVPFIYVSQTGPKWIDVENRENAVPSNMPSDGDLQTTVTNADSHKKYTTPAGFSNEPTFNDSQTNVPNHLTFNYINGAHRGTISPIHVTYKDQNGNVVSQGMITASDVTYGDEINIPNGTDITNPDHNHNLSGVAVPAGYSLDFDKTGSEFDQYQINSDYNADNYSDVTNIGQANQSESNKAFSDANDTKTNEINNIYGSGHNYVGQDITLYVQGNYTNSRNRMNATIEHMDANGKIRILGTLPINVNGFNGDTRTVNPSDFLPQAEQAFITTTRTDYKKNPDGTTTKTVVPILHNDILTNNDHPYTTKFLGNGQIVVENSEGQQVQPSDKGVVPSKVNSSDTVIGQDNPGNGMVFIYRDPTNQVNSHKIQVRYFYSDASDIPNQDTPTAKHHLIQLDQTRIPSRTTGAKFDLNPYIANPPKGYQFKTVLNDSDTTSAIASGNNTESYIAGLNNTNANNISLNSNHGSDTIDIQVVPTAGSITFHYYNQNGTPVKPDSDDKISDEKAGQDFTNGGYGYTNSNNIHYSDYGNDAINTHTEFGNSIHQYNNDNSRYYSRYGQYFNVSDIPVPTGYHLENDAPQSFNRYYRFNRTHQDVNVMVAGNNDDVANDPTNPSDPKITSGDATDNNTDSKTQKGSKSPSQHQDADTIWVTIHEMDPSNHQIRKYDIPEYISGDTGDTAHIYAADYTPEAERNQSGKVEYYFKPYASDTVNDTDNSAIGKNSLNNYTQANVAINSDGTTTADYDNDVHKVIDRNYNDGHNNHFDFYYYVKQSNNNMQPINVTYMDGSKAVGFKQIMPTMSDNYFGQDIKNTITYNNGDTHGDTPNNNTNIPSGYQLVNKNDNYPTTIDDNNPQDIVIPVMKNQTKNLSDTYTVIDNFYSGADHDMSHFVGTKSSTTHLTSLYSGETASVSASSNASYNGTNYSGGVENSSVVVNIMGNNDATPNVITYNYYHITSMASSQAGKQGTAVPGTSQPIYVQYYTGDNKSIVNSGNIPNNDWVIGNDTKLTGKVGTYYKDVTKVTPVPAGYHLDPTNQNVSHTVSDQPYQMDLHVSLDDTDHKAVNFPVTVILKDQNNNQITQYTTNQQISDNTSTTINQQDYDPNKNEFTYDNKDSRNYPSNAGTYNVKNTNGALNITNATMVYKMSTSTPSDIAPIKVTYIDKDNGQSVNANGTLSDKSTNVINTINGHIMNQNFSDITKSNGTGNSTVPSGYKLVPHQNLDDHISGNPQYVDVLVEKHNPNNNKYHLKINVVEENKDNGTAKYASDVYYAPITSDMTVDPHDFIPTSDAQTSDYEGNISDTTLHVTPSNPDTIHYNGNANSTAYYVDPVDHDQAVTTGQDRTITFIYDKGHQHNISGSIVLKYFNQNGQQVGYTDVMQGKGNASDGSTYNRYGQKVDVTNYTESQTSTRQATAKKNSGDHSDSTGEPVPTGYHLVPSDQPTKYTFNNDTQYVDLYLNGNTNMNTVNIYIHKETKSDPSGSAKKDITPMTETVNTPIGGTDTFNPNDYIPTNYHVDPSHTAPQSVTVNQQGKLVGPDGQLVTKNDMNSNINFYYKQNSIVYAKPYIVRYVNQNGQQVGYSDVVNNPNVIGSSDVNLTKLSDGGEPVPQGYQLDQSHLDKDGNPEAMSSNNPKDITGGQYSDHDVYNYKFGDNHVVTLKVIGEQVNVPLVVHLNKLNANGIPTSTSDAYGFSDTITNKRVGDSFYLTADQYLDKANAQSQGFDGHYLPGNSDGNSYQVAPNNINLSKGIDVDNTAKKATVEMGKDGKAYLALDEVNNNNHIADNQAIFYYEPAKNEQPSPINVVYINQNDGHEVGHGFINPSDDNGGKIGTYIGNVSGFSPNGHNPFPKSSDYHAVSSDNPATFMHNSQTVFVPVAPNNASNVHVTVYAHVLNAQGSQISLESSELNTTSGYGIGTSHTYSPYDYVSVAKGYSGLYPTNSDPDRTISDIQNDGHYIISFNYQQDNGASNNLGTINVHYVTKGQNSGDNLKISDTDYYQVDQESDHGFNSDSFDITDYLNDIPSYKNNYYHLLTGTSDRMNFSNTNGVIGYYDINGKPLSNPTVANGYTFKATPSDANGNTNDTHLAYGYDSNNSPYYSPALIDSNKPSNPDNYWHPSTDSNPNDKWAINTRDIYVLVAPDTYKPNGFNGSSTGNQDNNVSYDGGALPTNQGNDAGGEDDNVSY